MLIGDLIGGLIGEKGGHSRRTSIEHIATKNQT